MTFSFGVKSEILKNFADDKKYLNFLYIGMLISSVEIHKTSENKLFGVFVTEHQKSADALICGVTKITKQESTCEITVKKSSKGHSRYYIFISNIDIFLKKLGIYKGYVASEDIQSDVDEIIESAETMHYHDKENGYKLTNFMNEDDSENILKSFICGIFLANGSMTNPTSTYHLELAFRSEKTAKIISEIFVNYFGIEHKETFRNKSYILYIKEKDSIADILTIIGAKNKRLEFENIIVEKNMRNRINRIVNCDTANINRVTTVALRQIKSIKLIQKCGNFNQLDDKLIEIAEIRLKHPYASLTELSKYTMPKLSKSGINRRLNKIDKIAEKLKLQYPNLDETDYFSEDDYFD